MKELTDAEAREVAAARNEMIIGRALDRIRFIRFAAMTIAGQRGQYVESVWDDARTLWETKPDDC